MSIINDYLNGIKRRYPNTQAINEQIDELRDNLHIKTEEYQKQGSTYEAAANKAIASLGDVSSLFEEISGNVKMVYSARLNKDNALTYLAVIMAEFFAGWLIAYLMPVFTNFSWPAFLYSTVGILIGVGIWPVIAGILYKKEPDKKEVINFSYRNLMNMALIGWGIISIFVLGINAVSGFDTVWFIWPVIGVSNWPLNIWNYHRQLQSGKYDATASA